MQRVADPLQSAPATMRGAERNRSPSPSWSAALVVAPFFIYPVFLMQVLCFALFACAFNLLIGYVGLLSFGHALFSAGRAISRPMPRRSGASRRSWRSSPAPRPPRLCGLVAGSLAIRRQGIYFAMITLALAQMMYFFACRRRSPAARTASRRVPRGNLFGVIDLRNDMAMYVVVLVIFLAGFLLIYRIIHSPFGEVLKAIRENEPRAISLGYKTDHYKLVAFVLSATLAGLAGATKAIVLQLASLTDVNWPMSGEVVLMTLVGGLGTMFGPVVGAFVILPWRTSSPRPANG